MPTRGTQPGRRTALENRPQDPVTGRPLLSGHARVHPGSRRGQDVSPGRNGAASTDTYVIFSQRTTIQYELEISKSPEAKPHEKKQTETWARLSAQTWALKLGPTNTPLVARAPGGARRRFLWEMNGHRRRHPRVRGDGGDTPTAPRLQTHGPGQARTGLKHLPHKVQQPPTTFKIISDRRPFRGA